MLTIEARVTGRRREALPDWQLPLHDLVRGESPLTLREFIAAIVRAEVAAFVDRQSAAQFTRFLSAKQIVEQAERGRVGFGSRAGTQTVDPETAVGVALESFEDGHYFVLIDGRQYRSLDEQVCALPDSRVTFLRLVPLAGG